MQANLPPILAHALAAFAPPQSVVHQCFGDDDWIAVDMQLAREKSDPAARQRAVDQLTWHEAQMRMLTREAL